jgi:hypothetical protein
MNGFARITSQIYWVRRDVWLSDNKAHIHHGSLTSIRFYGVTRIRATENPIVG